MVIDTSALFAIEMMEPEARLFDERIRAASSRLMSVSNALELVSALSTRRGSDQRATVDDLISDYGLTLVPVDVEQMRIACEATVRFGKGRHAARLNYGDCFAYALSRAKGEPLLFKGDDFSRTDVAVA
ncbi:type II toxin-antitoxin system VapC family toxin [Brevundimonas sp. PAMC22021]|uniref:type II toxin-antitoxin system VapC family toxin n=1 Tax=Brevundimonas sp. PAMC22021 TaxID=2861285 RepID=UPI001C63374A|nr:type II toxin-antitoxin system VapC family toxin [Brevundimonas sp. PAMC22021]QYF86381.1 type II toxin-antitoxin system VapC family toxin [Brevundimonas sp. PAMC22021]